MSITRSDLSYHLPEELIAQEPAPRRSGSRLLVVDGGDGLTDAGFQRLPSLLCPGDLLVMNDTRVFPARLRGSRADTGGKVEVFLLQTGEGGTWKALIRPGRQCREGVRLRLPEGISAEVVRPLGRGRALLRLESQRGPLDEVLPGAGEVPLPPYIRRRPVEADSDRYQTVYARHRGAVAAPTAGLHFDRPVLRALGEGGVGTAFLTLHVGPGTFQPLREERLEDNALDPEAYSVPPATSRAVAETRRRGGRVVAVGTTTTRVLETLAREGWPAGEVRGETDLFIYPPFEFRAVDALLTNFHLPGSSLMGLVAAFAGLERIMRAYEHAVQQRYRFYSYGDAMLIL
ncbi:MAG: tRNA preQ1(34) S-adenosylmethionine ribosyltransferase-isomerase QueA [Candidatus Fermentibacteraceae bacterium]